MEVKVRGVNFNHQFFMKGIHNKVYRAQHRYYIEDVNKQLYEKMFNLASDLKEQFTLGFHITQDQYQLLAC